MKTTSINLTYPDGDFQKLKNKKEEHEKISRERINWEDFVFFKVCGK